MNRLHLQIGCSAYGRIGEGGEGCLPAPERCSTFQALHGVGTGCSCQSKYVHRQVGAICCNLCVLARVLSVCVFACVCACVCDLAYTYLPPAIGPVFCPTRHQVSVRWRHRSCNVR